MFNALKYTLYWRILIVFFHTKKLRILHTDTKHCSLGGGKLTLETLVLPQKSAAGMNT